MKSLKKILFPLLIILLGGILILFSPKRMVGLDDIADDYFKDSVSKASVAYGTTRLINAGVSVVKESTLQLEPGGVGVAVGVGQVADPLDDMAERLSSVLVTSIVSLLVQKISYEIAQEFVFQLMGMGLIIVGALSFFKVGFVVHYRNLILKIVLLLFIFRLFLPCSAFLSYQLNEHLFFPRIEEHETKLTPLVQDLKGLTTFDLPEVKGLGDIFAAPVRMMDEKSQQMNFALAILVNNGMEIFDHLIQITSLYLGVFVIQVIFMPLMMFWLLNKLVFILFSQPIAVSGLIGRPPAAQKPASEEN